MGIYTDHRRVKIEAETDCNTCLHRKVCGFDMEKRCENYEFGRSDGTRGCGQCLLQHTRWCSDPIPCFSCKDYEPAAEDRDA